MFYTTGRFLVSIDYWAPGIETGVDMSHVTYKKIYFCLGFTSIKNKSAQS